MEDLDILFERGVRGGDQPAREGFVRRAALALVRMVDRPGGPRGFDADAAVADVLSEVCLRPGLVDPGRPILPYLRQAVIRKAIDAWRAGRHRDRVVFGGVDEAADSPAGAAPGREPDPSSAAEWADLLDALLRCARGVLTPELFRTFRVLVDRWYDRPAAAAALGIDANVLDQRNHRIREGMRECWHIVEGRRP